MSGRSHLHLIVGGTEASPAEVPAIATADEAEQYCCDTYDRWRVEQAKLQPGNPHELTLPQSRSASRRSVMLLGRAIAGPEAYYRLGVLDWDRFVCLHARATGATPTEEHRVQLDPIRTADDVGKYMRAQLELLTQKCEATRSRRQTAAGQQAAFARFIAHLGLVTEAAAIFRRQGFLDDVAYEGYVGSALAMVLPRVVG